jgi:SNF2 family DNA or RNA helicase
MKAEYTARPYGKLITDHIMDHERCAVWAGMGMGKTVCTLTALDNLFMFGEDHPALVAAPLRVAKSTWPEEAAKWAHFTNVDSIMPIVGTEQERLRALRYDAAVYTINYENLPWLIKHYGDRWPFRTFVSDESTRLKNLRISLRKHKKTGKEFLQGQGGKRARSLGHIAHKHITRFIELTGTPAPNGYIDLWGQIWFIDVGQRLGRTFESYKNRWSLPAHDGYGRQFPDIAQQEIQERLKDVCITIDPADWFPLEKPIIKPVYADLPSRSRALYRDMEKEMFMELEAGGITHGIEAVHAAARTMKCLQITGGAVFVDKKATQWEPIHDEKIEALKSILAEANGMPVLVAYHFKPTLQRLLTAFPKGRHLDANPQTIRDWNAGKIPVMFAHPASAGHGLNLQDGGNILVYFDHWWNLEERDQILERIGPVRQLQAGYKRPVFIYNIIARKTVDELVIARTETKRSVQSLLLEAMKRGNCHVDTEIYY